MNRWFSLKMNPLDLVLEFMSCLFLQFTADAIPNEYLYELYCKWMEMNGSTSKDAVLGKGNFLDAIKKNIGFFPEWHIPDIQFRVRECYLEKPEKTLRLFYLEDWMQDPRSEDPNVKFRLKWKRPCMDGILRTKFKDRPLGHPPKEKRNEDAETDHGHSASH